MNEENVDRQWQRMIWTKYTAASNQKYILATIVNVFSTHLVAQILFIAAMNLTLNVHERHVKRSVFRQP